jgi:2-dehydro-3-deoxygluconokinase
LEQGQGARASSIIYDRADSAFAVQSAGAWDFDAALDGVGHLHLSGITPALGPQSAAAAQALANKAVERGVTMSFDGNFRPQLWASWDADPRAILVPLIECATVMFGNHRDIALLLDKPMRGDGEDRRREAADAAFTAFPRLQLLSSTARHVLGADHHRLTARVDRRDASYQSDEVDVTAIVDRIGTGDAYAAGVLDGWLRAASLEEMAESGLAMALLKHSLPGAFPRPMLPLRGKVHATSGVDPA